MFVGYFRDLDKDDLPKKSGVYLVYAGKPVSDKIVSLRKLFYIGESSNIHDRIVEHNRDKDWKDGLKEGELLYCPRTEGRAFIGRGRSHLLLQTAI